MVVFRYSGSKRRLLKHLPSPGFRSTIIEPFAGSLAYSFHYRPPSIIAAEANPLVRGLWEWLRVDATEQRLKDLERLKATVKVDARKWAKNYGLSEPEMTLLRLQTSGVYVGQLSSWVLYPQHKLNLKPLIEALPYLQKSLRPMLADFRQVLEERIDRNSFAFVDPPYLGTEANYKGEGDHGSIVPAEVTAVVKSLAKRCPVLFTYGDGAQETFPDFVWKKAVTRKVPMIRTGGTRERTEWYAAIS